jgi:uncharacterized protein
MAAAAAERDHRFSPVRPQELPGIAIEITVLSPMTPIPPDQVQVGVHGLYVKKDPYSGLLLPQVPVEWGWDRAEFLKRTFEKAGIPYPDPKAEILGFTAEHFEEQPPQSP